MPIQLAGYVLVLHAVADRAAVRTRSWVAAAQPLLYQRLHLFVRELIAQLYRRVARYGGENPLLCSSPGPFPAEELIDFEELRARLSALEETHKIAERELRALKHRTGRLERLERDRDSLLESYVGLLPEAIDALGSEERHRVYKMLGMKAHFGADGSFELSGDVISFSNLEISSA